MAAEIAGVQARTTRTGLPIISPERDESRVHRVCAECAQSVHRVHSPRYFYIFLNSFATHQVRVLAHEPGSSAPITPGLFSNRGRGRRAPCSIELSAASSDFRVETGESLRRAGKGRTDATLSVSCQSDHSAELSPHGPSCARRTCAAVWELTAYTNGYVFFTGHSRGELHWPIPRLGVP